MNGCEESVLQEYLYDEWGGSGVYKGIVVFFLRNSLTWQMGLVGRKVEF